MFDAFGRFANGIISHESSNQGGGGGHHAYRAPQQDTKEQHAEQELHLAADSLQLSSSKSIRVSMLHAEKTHQAYGKAKHS